MDENISSDGERDDQGEGSGSVESFDDSSDKSSDGGDNDTVSGLLGGLDIETSEEIDVPDKLIDQVIGQEHAREIIKKAARQHRHVMMIGSPGTGKSMLSKAMTELMPQENLRDILVYENPDDSNEPRVRTVPAGKGKQIIDAHKEAVAKKGKMRNILMWVLIVAILAYAFFWAGRILIGIIAAAVIYFLFRYLSNNAEGQVPNLLVNNGSQTKAPFEDATGAHAGALLGDVRHDPFQSGGMATPAHERVEAGAIHKADNGVLFIDEINTLDVRSQQKLMTAIQEGEFSITGQSERSSGAMVQTDPVPTNFITVAAGNMDAIENMHPALRDRIRGYGYEVYMDDTIDDTEENRRKYARFVAQEVERDGGIPHFNREAIEEIILEAKRRAGTKGKLTLRLRTLGGLVRTAGDIASAEDDELVTQEHVIDAKEHTQSIEQQYVDGRIQRRNERGVDSVAESEVGRVNGLAVMGEDSGIVLPVMSKVVESQHKEKGEIIATGKLQDIAEEAVDNVSAIIKDVGETDLTDKDIHVQFVQTHEGVQGDSASVTVATGIVSAMEDIPINQNVAMTGSLSVRGDVLPVGGVTHKIEAAAKSGIDTVLIPQSNKDDVMLEDEYKNQVEVIPVSHINEVLNVALKGSGSKKSDLLERLASLENSPELKTD